MIRRALLYELPDLAALGIRPPDLDEMWPQEIELFVAVVRARREERR